MHGLVPLFHAPKIMSLQSLVWREVGLSFIVASHFLQVSPVWSIPLPPEHQPWFPHTPGVSISNFLPLIQWGWCRKCPKDNRNFLFIQPRGVSAVCNCAGGRQFMFRGDSSISLLPRVGSSRMVVDHHVPSAHTTVQRGVPLVGVMRKIQFQWRTYKYSVYWFFMRYEGIPSTTWHSTM